MKRGQRVRGGVWCGGDSEVGQLDAAAGGSSKLSNSREAAAGRNHSNVARVRARARVRLVPLLRSKRVLKKAGRRLERGGM